jgi:prepilin-type N-terminal cleavage/methylation domain-containing protein
MMKKNGFTLAEVLITLAIIGVVASLTLPSLMTNTGEQQAKTAYKKLLNSLSEAGELNAAVNGFDYSTMNAENAGTVADNFAQNGTQTLGAILNEHFKLAPGGADVTLGAATNCAVITDGTAICLGTFEVNNDNSDIKTVLVDTNGTKGPNRHSECAEPGCTTAASKHIYDQFFVTLYGGSAYPGKWNAVRALSTDDTENNAALFAACQNINNTAGGGN